MTDRSSDEASLSDLILASPLIIFGVLGGGAVATLSSSSFTPAYVSLGVSTCALPALGLGMVARQRFPRQVGWAMLATVFGVCVAWVWQRVFYTHLMPPGPLTYGYFLTQAGASARLLILTGPTYVVGTVSAVLCGAAVALAWRAGARWSILWLIAWWLAACATFMLPSAYLSGQGEASVFI